MFKYKYKMAIKYLIKILHEKMNQPSRRDTHRELHIINNVGFKIIFCVVNLYICKII